MKRSWLFTTVLILTFSGLFAQDGLVAYYPFNGDAIDVSGNGNHGDTFGHEPTLVADRFGNESSAYHFNGTDDYIQVPHSTALDSMNQITVSLWVKFESEAPYYFPYAIIEKYGSWDLGQRGRDIHWGLASADSNLSHWTVGLELGTYYHIVMTYNEIEMRIYINNTLDTTLGLTGPIYPSNNDIYIGEYPLGGNYYYNGIIDDIRIYNYTLLATEIESLYHEGGWDSEPEDSLVAYYPFNENANDESGNGHDGIVEGAMLTMDRFGIGNSAYSFDGVNDYIHIPITKNEHEEFTMNIWADGYGTIICPKTSEYESYFGLAIDDTLFYHLGWFVDGFYFNNKVYPSGTYDMYTIQGYAINDTDYGVQAFFNGQYLGSREYPYRIPSWQFIEIGRNPVEENNLYGGNIDDISIYNRILSAAEIDSLYHDGGWNPEPDLIAYYPFNGNADDESGNVNHGITSGHSPTLIEDRFGNDNSAYHFDGSNDYIQIPHSPALDSMNQITVSLWVKLESEAPYYFPYHIIEKYGSWNLGQRQRDIRWEVSSFDSYTDHWVNSLYLDTYYHIVMTCDDLEMRIYVNNSLETDIEVNGLMAPSVTDIYIGEYTFGGDYYYEGTIDDIRIYERALSELEIESLYHEGGWDIQESMIEANLDIVEAETGDTVQVPLHVILPADSLYDSAEITLGSYQAGLQFLGIDTVGTMLSGQDWTWSINETDTLLFTATAGSNDISGGGVFCDFTFLVTGEICTNVPIEIVYAKFNSTEITETEAGLVYIQPVPLYGDVDSNGAIEAHDAALILKHIAHGGADSLICQAAVNADVNQSVEIEALDASIILQYVVQLIDSLPVEPDSPALVASGDVSMENINAIAGTDFELPVFLQNGDNILSFEGRIEYDPSDISPQLSPIVWTNLLSGFMVEIDTEEAGVISFAGASANPDGSAGVFATLMFTATDEFAEHDITEIIITSIRFNGNIHHENIVAQVNGVVGVDNLSMPAQYSLDQNYPNPFNPSTTLRYGLPEDATVSLIIYDIRGNVVKTIDSGAQVAGWYEHVWNGLDESGQLVSTGLYLTRLQAGAYSEVIKMVYLR